MTRSKKTYIEALRIIAIFLVLFQHVPAFDYYLYQTDLFSTIVTLILSLITKINVPLFLMISGSLLLRKEESYSLIFRKRMIKIILAILIFNFMVYLAENDFSLNIYEYVIGVFENGIDRSYWYLYSYLGFLIMQPFLHRIAMRMNVHDFMLILFFHFVFSTFEPIAGFFVSAFAGDGFDLTWAFRIPFSTVKEIFYPMTGYYIDRVIREDELTNKRLGMLGLGCIAGIAVSIVFSVLGGFLNGMSDAYFELFDYVSAIFVFLLIKVLFQRHSLPDWLSSHIIMLGSLTYGIYLWDPFFRKLFFKTFSIFLAPSVSGFFISVFWCIFSFTLCGSLVYMLKRIPKIQKLF